jgi:FKBP-type peptidyl-prolyl cis-trans isomerase FklB
VKIIVMGIADKLFNMKNEKAAVNLKAGQDFLEANKSKPGVVALPSGLQYEVLTEGTGSKPLAKNNVTCHYHGTLIDGTVFDSSVRRGQPATFPLNAVIKGWTEGLQLMPTGSKWRFFIPANLGYGDRQVGAQIGPNSALIFEVELLSFS